MYRCQVCGGLVPPRTPRQSVVIRRRAKQYPFRRAANHVVRMVDGRRKEKDTDDPGGCGWETLAEVGACPRCASRNGTPGN
jgi:hypothetical protein